MVVVLLSLLWLVREIKAFLFWLYLWQLKEYHIGRFIDHFRTYNGKRIFLNALFVFKAVFLVFCWWLLKSVYFIPIHFIVLLSVVYSVEAAKFVLDIHSRKLKKPVVTLKIVFLAFGLLFALACYRWFFPVADNGSFVFFFLLFDVFTPVVVSGIVLLFQPVAVLLRGRIISRAKKKMKTFKSLKVIGITGSYGKSSTKEFLAQVLADKYKVLKTKANQNSEVGISKCVLDSLKPEHEVFIVEMGAYGRGGIKLLCDIVGPDIGVLTGINEQHMALFGSLENTVSAKFELIESLPENGLAVLNVSSEVIDREKDRVSGFRIKPDKVVLCSVSERLGVWAENVLIKKDSLYFRVRSKDGDSAQFKMEVLGKENIENVLLVCAVCKELGMGLEEVARVCEDIKPSDPKLVNGAGGVSVIDSTYSANPNGVFSHLKHLKFFSGKKVIIMPCLIELGSASAKIHEKIGEMIAENCDLGIVVTRDRFNDVKRGGGDKVVLLEKPGEIFKKVKEYLNPDDVILLEGRLPQRIKDFIYGN